jgi:hypothetical protein
MRIMGYVGWELPTAERERLLVLVPAAYPRLTAHHVTQAFGVGPRHPLPVEREGRFVGIADDRTGAAVAQGRSPPTKALATVRDLAAQSLAAASLSGAPIELAFADEDRITGPIAWRRSICFDPASFPVSSNVRPKPVAGSLSIVPKTVRAVGAIWRPAVTKLRRVALGHFDSTWRGLELRSSEAAGSACSQ